MISSRLTTTERGILSHTFIPENARQMVERRILNNKRFGKLELSVEPFFDQTIGDTGALPRNLVAGFLLDTSGSMEGVKIKHAKNTIQKFVEVIHAERNGKTIEGQPFHAWIYVITFDSDAELVIPFQEITDETLPKIIEQLEHIYTRGSTNYERAFQKQTEVIEDILAKLNETHQQRHQDQGEEGDSSNDRRYLPHYHFMQFFETDGEITQGSSNIKKLYAMMRNTAVHTPAAPSPTVSASTASTRLTFEYYTIGYGTDVDLGCLKTLASPYPPASSSTDYNCSSLVTILKPEDIGWQVGEILFKVIMRYANKVEVGVSVVGPAAAAATATPGTIEIFEYQTHQWGTSTTLHSIIHGEKKALWVQYTPAPDASETEQPIQIHVKIQYENQFTGENFTWTFEHEIHNDTLDIHALVPDLPTTQPQQQEQLETTMTFQTVISLILGMVQIEIFKQFREIEAGRYDKDTIVREAYKTKRMLNSIDEITRRSSPAIASQTLNLMTDVKVIIGLTTINNPREQSLVLHARRICSAEQAIFNTGAEVSRKYMECEEEHEEEAERVIQAAKGANGQNNNQDQQHDQNLDEEDACAYEQEGMDDALPSRIPTTMPSRQDFETPFAAGGGGSHRRNNAGGSELRALCVKIAVARNKKEDISAEELYKQLCSRHYSYHHQYDAECDAPRHDDTFSSTPMDDDYTQRRIGMMRQMSS
jgi:hypothetical protein